MSASTAVRDAQPFVIRLAPGEPPPDAHTVFDARKTMYGGKDIAVGDAIFVFGDVDGVCRLMARGIVRSVAAVPKKPGITRQTPRVDLAIGPTTRAARRLGRDDLEHCADANLAPHAAELHFKFFRQATPKIGGISHEAAAFLDRFFAPVRSARTTR